MSAVLALAVLLPASASAANVKEAAAEVRRMPAADPDPVKSLAFNVLRHMAGAIAYDGAPPRDPHEWTGERAVREGKFNGCVEAAKAFKALYDAAAAPRRAVFVGGTRKREDGGHAVIELTGEDGRPFLIDTALFERVAPRLREQDAALPEGRTIQTGREDLHFARRDGRYVLSRWDYGYRFREEHRRGPDQPFSSLAEANAWLSRNAFRGFADLEPAGIVQYPGAAFVGPTGELEHVYLKTADEPFSGTDRQRVESGQRAVEDKVKFGP